MFKANLLNLFTIIITLSFTNIAYTSEIDEITSYFSNSILTVEIYEIVAPQKAIEYGNKIQKSIINNREWWHSYVKKTMPGKPLPYHSNMGVSKSEYEEYLILAQKFELRKTGISQITINKQNEKIILNGNSKLEKFKNITIDKKRNSINTEYGSLTIYNKITASKNQQPEPWNGHQWKYEKSISDSRGILVKLAVGKTNSNKGIIYYDVKDARTSKPNYYSYILLFNLK